MFHKLPPELFRIILEYAAVKDRNGKYINQIEKTDARYNILTTIPPIQVNNPFRLYNKFYEARLRNNVCIYYFPMEYHNLNDSLAGYLERNAQYHYVFHAWEKKCKAYIFYLR
jgi:hypothetical protein